MQIFIVHIFRKLCDRSPILRLEILANPMLLPRISDATWEYDCSARRARQGVPRYWAGRWVRRPREGRRREEEGRLLGRRVFPESQGCAGTELPRVVVVAGVRESVHTSRGQVGSTCAWGNTHARSWVCPCLDLRIVPRRRAGNLEKRADNNDQWDDPRTFMVRVHVIRCMRSLDPLLSGHPIQRIGISRQLSAIDWTRRKSAIISGFRNRYAYTRIPEIFVYFL